MALKIKYIFIAGLFLIPTLWSCDSSPSGSEPKEKEPPITVEITSPKAETTYWDDQAISCAIDDPKYADEATWLIDGEAVACIDGELDTRLASGEHTVTARIADVDDEANVTITVKEGFSVTLAQPKDGAEYFVGDEVSCSATIDPEKYAEHLQITVGGESCRNGEAELKEAGENTFRAFATIDGRTEAQEAIVIAKQAVAGKVYPLTDRGVASEASGFTVTLTAGGEVIDTKTDADGKFAIKSERINELGSQDVTLEVAASGNFYGARAEGISADELLALVEADELGFILAPKRWTIRDGKLSGNSTQLKLKDAFTRVIESDSYSSFYKLTKVFGEYKYVSVFSEHLPLPVAFNDAKNDVDITKSDSTDFWKQTDNFTEPYVGRGDLFTPTTIHQIPTVFDGIHVYSGKAGDRSGASGASGDAGYIVGGHIDLAIDKFGTWVQTHEQIHNLDFGHASHWDGIMTYEVFHGPNGERIRVPGKGMKTPSVNDVAHIQVYIDAFDLQFSENISFGVLEWMQALNIKGLPETTSSQEKTSGKHFASYTYETIECRIH